jgi:hypothetical protein
MEEGMDEVAQTCGAIARRDRRLSCRSDDELDHAAASAQVSNGAA